MYATIVRTQTIITNENELLAWSIRQFRRTLLRDFIYGIVQAFGDFDYSMPQLATLLLLDEENELTIKQVAEALARSVSATSRLLDQLVMRGMISRREDERDRRGEVLGVYLQRGEGVSTIETTPAHVPKYRIGSL